MRVFISNTAADQTSQMDEANNFDLNDDNAPSWTLKVEGRLLDVSIGDILKLDNSMLINWMFS
jgi:chromatin remodeling complex protein RSC6